jgi:hypothetical protein
MNEPSAPQVKSVDDRSEYLKFAALLLVTLVAILALAVLSPVLIGQRAPVVLGLEGLPAGRPGPAAEEMPAIEKGPAAEPDVLMAPESALEAGGGVPAGMGIEGFQHEVQPGQTLFQIAELYGVSVEEIAAANHLVNPLQLQPGTILIIPQPR